MNSTDTNPCDAKVDDAAGSLTEAPQTESRPDPPIRTLTRQQTDMFRLLVESVKDYAIFLLDPHGYVITWNPGAERIKGYAAEEIIGRHFSTFYTEDAKQSHHPDYELKVATREGRFEEEGWRVRKDGSLFWANVVITALYDEHGQVRGFAKVTRDMTDRKRADEELRHARDILEQRVAERTGELMRSNQTLQAEVERRQRLEGMLLEQADQLREEAELKDQFLAMLAHELRNPLGALSNALHILVLSPPGSPSFDRAKNVALRQMAHQTRLIDDLLDVSRLRRGKIEIIVKSVDLTQIVREALEDYTAAFDAADISASFDAPLEPVKVRGDHTRLTQIMSNLFDNARKYTPAGGRVAVRVRLDREASRARVSVQDTGIGIEAKVIERLFEPFAQADHSLDRSQGGLGLGLALVKGLTELHGGTVEVRSAGADQGAEFVVSLPLEAAPRPCTHPQASGGSAVGAVRRVLVIEDVRDAAETLQDLLELLGYEVTVAFDGNEGVRKAIDEGPRVILCDLGLPGIDGFAVASELRRHPQTANTPLVAVTGYGTDDDRRRTRDLGFQAHLIKPIDPIELQKILDGVIAKGR